MFLSATFALGWPFAVFEADRMSNEIDILAGQAVSVMSIGSDKHEALLKAPFHYMSDQE